MLKNNLESNLERIFEKEIDFTALSQEDLSKKILFIKVGSDEYPASNDDIKQISQLLELTFKNRKDKPIFIITHHAFDVSAITMEDLLKENKENEN